MMKSGFICTFANKPTDLLIQPVKLLVTDSDFVIIGHNWNFHINDRQLQPISEKHIAEFFSSCRETEDGFSWSSKTSLQAN